jgi:hypothetical protein
VNCFLPLKLRMMSFGIGFLHLGPKNMSYLCIKLSLFGTLVESALRAEDMLLQLKIVMG